MCSTPVRIVATSRYCKPWSLTRPTINNAMAPVAAEIIPGRPPVKAITTEIQNAAYKPTFGSTPAITEKAIASGTRARATTTPASQSPLTLQNQSSRNGFNTKSLARLRNRGMQEARKLVGYGKSGYVRVDNGGGRLIKT